MNTTLVVIDIQNDYFANGRFPLPGAQAAGTNAARLLAHFRDNNLPVVHIQHEAVHEGAFFFLPGSQGQKIHPCAAPRQGEGVVVKHKANSFLKTDLKDVLHDIGADHLVLCGMMTNNCVDATVRAAADMGYGCTVVHDACAAADLSFGDVDVPAAQVHAAFMAALGFSYARVVSTQEYVGEKD